MVHDYDKVRAAYRAGLKGEGPSARFFGKEVQLPLAMPMLVVDALATDDAAAFRTAVVALVGEAEYQRVLPEADATELAGFLAFVANEVYGGAPDPEASSASSDS